MMHMRVSAGTPKRQGLPFFFLDGFPERVGRKASGVGGRVRKQQPAKAVPATCTRGRFGGRGDKLISIPVHV